MGPRNDSKITNPAQAAMGRQEMGVTYLGTRQCRGVMYLVQHWQDKGRMRKRASKVSEKHFVMESL